MYGELLARETLEFDHAIRLLEATDKRTHPLRLELNNFFFVQAIAGPYRSKVMSVFLHGISWLTLVALPVILILYIQVVFLPYHNEKITWTHRIALLVDIAMLISIGVFLMRAEPSFVQAFLRTTSSHPMSVHRHHLRASLGHLLSFFFATIPGEPLDRVAQSVIGIDNEDETGQTPRFAKGFALPFLAFGSEGSLLGIFQRNLVVIDTDLVVDKDADARASRASACAGATCASPSSTAATCIRPTSPAPTCAARASPAPIFAARGCSART